MKNPKDKQDLIETVVDQIRQDVHCGEYDAMEIFLNRSSIEDLINYLPAENWKQFKHLKHAPTT